MSALVTSVEASDGVSLHVEVAGSGHPILFIHEFAGDHRSWEPQVRAFSRRYRCVTYAARGYPPSAVPDDPGAYSQNRAVADAIDVLDALEISRAHIVGLSMGGFCALHMGLFHADRTSAIVVGGVGYGALPEARARFQAECEVIAQAFETEGAAAVAERYAFGPARVQFQAKDPRGHAEFAAALAQHSSEGSARTMRGFQKERPSLYDFGGELANLRVPMLVMVGDEDEGAIEPSVMLKRSAPASGLVVFPKTGHTLNLEEPTLFNTTVQSFFSDVESGFWGERDPRSLATSTTGMDE